MTNNSSRRRFLSSAAGAAVAGGSVLAGVRRALAQEGRTFTPEMFGAKGDGVTNDSRALHLLGRAVTEAGGGTVVFRATTYIVGEQVPILAPAADYYFGETELLSFTGCTRPVVVRGNGAKLKCAAGLRYGVFDREGRPAHKPMPYLGPGRATPYISMISAERCAGGIEISDFELDGNLPGLIIGGQYGDTGRQIPANGIRLLNNVGPELIRNVYCHHHPLDGVIIDGVDTAAATLPQRLIEGLRAEYNGRQGVSLVGGRGYAFRNCTFSHTGRSTIDSPPGAGVDIEAEGDKKNRDYSFTDCAFVDNIGCGLVADSGDSEGATFTRCTFVGTTAWSAWPRKPRFRFTDCRFVGSLVHAYGDKDPQRAAHFTTCTFLDDPKLSPTGKVYLGDHASGPIADLSDGLNVLFKRCTFRLTGNGLLPWSWHAFYDSCRMDQASKTQAYPKGKYLGTGTLNGNVDLYGTRIFGTLTVNGRVLSNVTLGQLDW